MNKLFKFALVSAAAASAVAVGWSFVRRHPSPPPAGADTSSPPSAPPDDLTEGQQEQLLEELEAQLNA